MNYAIHLCKNDEYTPENGHFFEKMMKKYLETVILSLKICENILKFNFLVGGGGGIRHTNCLRKFLKRSFIDVKNDEGVVI